jgi:hypothetical protein
MRLRESLSFVASSRSRRRVILTLAITHCVFGTVGAYLGRVLAISNEAFWEDVAAANFFAPAFRLQLRYGGLPQARVSLQRYEDWVQGNRTPPTFQRNISLLEAFATLAVREEAKNGRMGTDTALQRAAYYCQQAQLGKCSPSQIRDHFVK